MRLSEKKIWNSISIPSFHFSFQSSFKHEWNLNRFTWKIRWRSRFMCSLYFTNRNLAMHWHAMGYCMFILLGRMFIFTDCRVQGCGQMSSASSAGHPETPHWQLPVKVNLTRINQSNFHLSCFFRNFEKFLLATPSSDDFAFCFISKVNISANFWPSFKSVRPTLCVMQIFLLRCLVIFRITGDFTI